LAGQQITPVAKLFVRNCQPPPQSTSKDSLDAWKLDLAGLVNRPQTVNAKMLRALEQTKVEMVVQCSGNGRKLFSESAKTEGTQWGRGGMGNVEFGGVPLAGLLNHLGVKALGSARFLTAEGRDDPKPGEMDFEHSLPLEEALEKSILALELNGSPLPYIHGGPLRLVTPGYYGTMHVKWVTRLLFGEQESNHTSHMPHYRTPLVPIKPGEKFEPTFANSEPNWRMKLKCVVLSPAPGAMLASGDVSVVGVAFNDGEARIESVLVSCDEGASWQQAKLDVPASAYAWYRWQAKVMLSAGKRQIWSRAVDALGRSQPLDGSIYWNPRGYTWNGVEKIDVTVG
jgi:DMSO/TMAO reductase YedYZ molybdopterin-dependent catalytic subunit